MSSLSTAVPRPLPDALSDVLDLKPFAEVELIVLDLDGTLLRHANDLPDVSEWNKRSRLVSRLQFRGVPLTLATGRAYEGARVAMSAVARKKNAPFILYNGSAVTTGTGLLLAHRALTSVSIAGLTDVVEQYGGNSLTYWLRTNLSGHLDSEWVVFVGSGEPPDREFNGLPITSRENIPADAVCVAALLWTDDQNSKARLLEELGNVPGISITVSGSSYVEVRPAGSSKAAGLDSLLGHLRIPPRQVLAIGDNDNDAELLLAVGVSVCVANASPQARSVSQYQTTYPSTSGVIEVLDLVARARRLWTGGNNTYGK